MAKIETILKQIRAFNHYLKNYWSLEALVLLVVLLTSFLSLPGPYLTRLIIDQAFGRHDLYLFHVLIIAGFLLYLFQNILAILQQYLSAYIGRLLTFDLRSDYTRHLFALSYPAIHRRATGEQLYRLEADIDAVSTLATDSIPLILSTSVRLLSLLGICFYLNWRLTLATLIISPLFYFHTRYFGRREKGLTKKIKQESQDTTSIIQDVLANVKLIKAFNRERWAVRSYLRRRVKIIRLNLNLARLTIFGNHSAGFINTVILIGFTYYIGYNVIKGRVTLGTLVALILYLVQLFAALKMLGGLYRNVMSRFVSWERILETLWTIPERRRSEANSLTSLKGEISCRSVSFGYQPGEPVLKKISFRIEAGEFAGITGPSGSGKSTLLMLLLRLFAPWDGTITIDGRDLKDIRWRSIQPFIGLALQEAPVLNRSVAVNLRLGYPEASEKEMWRALEIADLAATIKNAGNRLETIVGESGSSLSEGQRQRLNIARAVIGSPRILVMDEATSSIDFESESRILAGLRAELPQTTIIFASHRFSPLQQADLILVLKDGELVEKGDHRGLMKINGFYHRLFSGRGISPEANV